MNKAISILVNKIALETISKLEADQLISEVAESVRITERLFTPQDEEEDAEAKAIENQLIKDRSAPVQINFAGQSYLKARSAYMTVNSDITTVALDTETSIVLRGFSKGKPMRDRGEPEEPTIEFIMTVPEDLYQRATKVGESYFEETAEEYISRNINSQYGRAENEAEVIEDEAIEDQFGLHFCLDELSEKTKREPLDVLRNGITKADYEQFGEDFSRTLKNGVAIHLERALVLEDGNLVCLFSEAIPDQYIMFDAAILAA